MKIHGAVFSLQDQNVTLMKRAADLENNLTETQTSLTSRTQELSGVASTYTAKMNDILSQHKEELNNERQKSQQVRAKTVMYTCVIIFIVTFCSYFFNHLFGNFILICIYQSLCSS